MAIGVIALDVFLQRPQHLALVILGLHVDEVDNNDAAEIAQAQLAHNSLSRFQVGLEDGLFKVAMADIGAGVDVDGRHRLGLVDHQVPAGLQLHLALQRFLDFVVDTVEIENRPLAGIVFQFVEQLGRELTDKAVDALEGLTRIDAQFLDFGVGDIAQHAQHQRQIFVHDFGGLRTGHLFAYRRPQALQEMQVRGNGLLVHTFGRGTQDEAAGLPGVALAHDNLAQPLAFLFVLDALRHTDVGGFRHEYQITRGNGDVGGQAGALGAQRILDDLHQHLLAFLQQAGDVFVAGHRNVTAVVAEHRDVRSVQESRPLQSDVDKRRLHARQHAADNAFIDVANQPAAPGALDKHFLQDAVLHHRHAGFLRRYVDQQLYRHVC